MMLSRFVALPVSLIPKVSLFQYGAMSAPAPSGGRGVDIWLILDGIPNTAGKVREVIGPLLPEEGMDT